MKTAIPYLVLCLNLALAGSAYSQIVLNFDVDERGVAPSTQSGFPSLVLNSNPNATAVQTLPTVRTFGAQTVTIAGLGNPSYDDRIRTVPSDSPPNFNQAFLLRDFVFQSSTTNGDGLRVTFDGLTPDQFYKITIWSYDNSSTGNRVSDWFANGFLVRAAYLFNGSVLPTNDLQYQLNFKVAASPAGQIQVDGRRTAATASAGSVFINAMQVEITTPDPPTVTTQPTGNTLYAGDNTDLITVQAAGAAPLAFQWRLNGTDVPNATNNSLRVFNAQAANAGAYTCVITNIGGGVTSSVATVTVLAVATLESGRIAYWPLDGINPTLPDASTPDVGAGANDLYLTNLTTANLTQGAGGNAMSFNGSNSLAVRFHTNSVGLPAASYPAYTVALWVKGNFTNQLDRRVFSESSHTNNSPLLNIGTDNAGTNSTVDIFIRLDNGSTPVNHRKSSLVAFDGNWHHIAWVDNNGFPTLYVDGVADTNDFNYPRGPLTATITSLGGILRTAPGNWYGGLIDDVAVFRRSLSVAEVRSVMQCGPSLAGTGPVITQDPQSRTNNEAGSTTFEVRATGSARLDFQWYFGGTALAGQTRSTLVLSNLAFAQSGPYSVTVSNCFGGPVTSAAGILTVNRLPLPLAKGVATPLGQAVTIPISKLMTDASDPDGDPVAFVTVSATSTNGAAVTLTGTNVTYTPQPGFSGIDRFTYTIADNRGATNSAAVEVFVATGSLPSQNMVSLTPTAQGYLVRFAGIPGRSYRVERSPDLSTWTTLATIVAPLYGIIEYEDTNPPQPSAFYRTVLP